MEEYTHRKSESLMKKKRRAKARRLKRKILLLEIIAGASLLAFFLHGQTGWKPSADSTGGQTAPLTLTAAPDIGIAGPQESEGTYFAANREEPDDWYLILVNKWNAIPDDYPLELTELSNGQLVDTRIYTALRHMLDAAKADGVYTIVVSGFRTAEKQQRLLEDKIAEYRKSGYSDEEAREAANTWVAFPGYSEHQLGLSVDINADGIHSTGEQVYEWLEQNGCLYGFIFRYPPDKTDITGTINEPWHYRYVGVEAATEITEQGLCLEEYLGEV